MMKSTKVIKQFDIYWANLNPTIGSEIKKIRPCIIVSPDIMNELLNTVMVVPITSTIINWPFRLKINSTGKTASAACDQIRSISTERITKKIGTLSKKEQKQILEILLTIFG